MDKLMHHIEIKIPNSSPSNTEITLDGQPLLGVTALKVEAHSDGSEVAKVTLTMLADIAVDIDADTYREYTVNRNSGEYITDADRA